MTKPTIVLIPGAWHTAACYSLLTPYLNAAGYTTVPLTLPSSGADPAIPDIGPDVEVIRQAVSPLLDEGKDVVVVMHSYGGIPGSSAMKGLGRKDREVEGKAGGVVGLVYICAWMLDEGVSMVEAGGGRGGKGGPATLKIENNRSTHLSPYEAMYHDVPHSTADPIIATLQPFSFPCRNSPVTYAAHRFIPTTYLLATGDKMIVHERQLELVRDANAAEGVEVKAFTCDASHSPFASRPEWVSGVVRWAAGEKDLQVDGGA